jgi:hypothetical protein
VAHSLRLGRITCCTNSLTISTCSYMLLRDARARRGKDGKKGGPGRQVRKPCPSL